MEREELVLGLGELAVRFSEGWHEGIKIDALDIVLLNEAAEALAQPAQKPAAWMYPDALCDRACLYVCTKAFTQFPECATAPPQPAQEPVAWMVYTLDGASVCVTDNPADFTPEHRALPLYTIPPQPAQEPVAWMHPVNETCVTTDPTAYARGIPLYTAPPQRPWVGLAQDEQMQIWDGIIKYAPSEMRIKDFAQAIEAKLKEKNT